MHDVRVLADELSDWTWWDHAAYELGRAIGLFSNETFHQVKYVFWTNNDLGKGLHEALSALVRAGVLEQRDEPDDQYRWSPTVGPVTPVRTRTAP